MHFRTVPMMADESEVSKATIYRWIKRGLLKPTRLGSKYRITEEQWAAFVDQCNKPRKEEEK